MTTKETREARITRLLEMRKTMTVTEIAKIEGKSRARIGQLLGPTRTTNPILIDVHHFICEYQHDHKIPPTITEIAEAFPTTQGRPRSTSVITYWLSQMERLKMIEPRQHGKVRNIVAKKLPRTPAVLEMQAQGNGHE